MFFKKTFIIKIILYLLIAKYLKEWNQYDWTHIFSILHIHYKNDQTREIFTIYLKLAEKLEYSEENQKIVEKFRLRLTNIETINKVSTSLVKNIFLSNSFDANAKKKIQKWVKSNYPDSKISLKEFY